MTVFKINCIHWLIQKPEKTAGYKTVYRIIFKKAKNYTAIHLQGLKGGSSISGDLQEKKTSTNHSRDTWHGCDWWRQLHQSQPWTSREVMHFSLVGNVVYSILIVIKHVFTKTSVNANLLGVSTGAYWTSLQPEFLWWVYIAFLRFYWLFRDRKWGKWMRESFPGTKLLCSIKAGLMPDVYVYHVK